MGMLSVLVSDNAEFLLYNGFQQIKCHNYHSMNREKVNHFKGKSGVTNHTAADFAQSSTTAWALMPS